MSARHASRARHARARQNHGVALCLMFAVLAVVVVMVVPAPATSPRGSLTARLIDDGATTTTTLAPGSDSPLDTTTPAPTNYADQLDTYYASVYNIVNSVSTTGSNSTITTPDEFDAQVATMTPAELAGMYQISDSYIDFATSTPTMTQAATDSTVVAQRFHIAMRHSGAALSSRAVARTVARAGAHDVSIQSPTIIPDTEPTTGSWAGDVSGLGLVYQATCPAGAPTGNDPYGEYDIFAINEGTAAANAIYDVASAGAPDDLIPLLNIGFNAVQGAVSTVAAIIVTALQIAHDTLAWEQSVSGACQSADTQLMTLDEDNNAYQTFELLTGVAATTNEIDTNIVNLANQESAEQAKITALSVEEALAAPLGTVPQARLELPATDGGLLDAPVGVEEIVVGAITTLTNDGQLSNPSASRQLGLAEQAQSAGEYKLAFSYYQRAYQDAGE